MDETLVIGYGGYYHISTVFQGGEAIYLTVRVQEGGPIDVLLMNSGDFVNFERFMPKVIDMQRQTSRRRLLRLLQLQGIHRRGIEGRTVVMSSSLSRRDSHSRLRVKSEFLGLVNWLLARRSLVIGWRHVRNIIFLSASCHPEPIASPSLLIISSK